MSGSAPFLPGSTIGIVGGGQLGRMLALEARRMGYRTAVLDPDPAAPAGQVADVQITGPLTDLDAARELARVADVVTLEWENADLASVTMLAEHVPVRPGPHVLEIAQNRILEKRAARRLGLETAPFHPVHTLEELTDAVAALGTPAVLKTATGGYDGKGQRLLRTADDAADAFAELGGAGRELILEGWVDFTHEVSVICARSPSGETASFPVSENMHSGGILDVTVAPARIADDVRQAALEVGETLLVGLDVIGILAVELFVTADGRILVNEIAPRPHNSGHYTWEGCSESQFEQQLRAVCGLPIHTPLLLRPAAMANLLGEDAGTGLGVSGVFDALATPGIALHLYGKSEARRGRKMGHLTALGADADTAHQLVVSAREALRKSYDPA